MTSKIILCIILLVVVLLCALIFLVKANKKNKKGIVEDNENFDENIKSLYEVAVEGDPKVQFVEDFLDFDKIINSLIVRENGNKFTAVVESHGINFDLMSAAEQSMIEEGFIGLLNFIQFPIQIYVQTRQIDLKDSIDKYNQRVYMYRDDLNNEIEKYNIAVANSEMTEQELKLIEYQINSKRNLYEYSIDLVDNIESMTNNSNVLQQKYYICLTYYSSELGLPAEATETEKIERARQELFNRASGIVSALSGCGITAEILNSADLAELLYMAFNRDDGAIYRLKDSMAAKYHRLFSTIQEINENEFNMNVEEGKI